MILHAKGEMYIVRAVLWAGSACPLPTRQTAQGIQSTGQGGISPAKSTDIIIYVACVLGDHSVLAGGSAGPHNSDQRPGAFGLGRGDMSNTLNTTCLRLFVLSWCK